ncbi:MAG TPA: tyrosine-type recombinase/integrase, partial [Dehalococcoidia bacterium]|nr:tyrosine-type recombinase/integrase [Dehalococcoidia bacterium]
FYAFLAEKERRSGSLRTVQSYSRMLDHFFSGIGKTPDQVKTTEVFSWAHGIGLSGKRPSSVTIGARIACLSSFYRFLIRMELIQANPCDKLERPKATPAPPRGLVATDIGLTQLRVILYRNPMVLSLGNRIQLRNSYDIQRLLSVIPDTPVGLRDRAIILVLTLTGRRRTEVLSLKAGDLYLEGDAVYYTYRGKGGKQGKGELPQPAFQAMQAALAGFGKGLATMKSNESLWPSAATADGESPAAPSTAICGGTSRQPDCPHPEYTYSAIVLPSCGGMPESRWSR